MAEIIEGGDSRPKNDLLAIMIACHVNHERWTGHSDVDHYDPALPIDAYNWVYPMHWDEDDEARLPVSVILK